MESRPVLWMVSEDWVMALRVIGTRGPEDWPRVVEPLPLREAREAEPPEIWRLPEFRRSVVERNAPAVWTKEGLASTSAPPLRAWTVLLLVKGAVMRKEPPGMSAEIVPRLRK